MRKNIMCFIFLSETMNQCLAWSYSPEASASDSLVLSLKNVFIQIGYIHLIFVSQISFSSLFFRSFPFFTILLMCHQPPYSSPASPFSYTHIHSL